MNILDDLAWRGLVQQTTSDELASVLEAGPVTLYVGFDPTGPSLHVGHLLGVIMLRRFQRAGHRVIALTGGGTGMIGDPSGRSSERNLLTLETLAENRAQISAQIRRFLDAPDNPPLFLDNLEWLGSLGLLDFLRDTAKHFSVNAMIQKDSVRLRLEREGEGISFTEFSYALLQARDFLELHRRHGCTLQAGGSDQWGNIVGGVDLIRRVAGARAFGLTWPLLTDAEGRKFGKSEGKAVHLSAAMTSAYAFHQFWLNQADADVLKLIRMLTDAGPADVADLEAGIGDPARPAQRYLADHMTRLVHGEDARASAERAGAALFSGDIRAVPVDTLLEIFAEVPAVTLPAARAAEGVPLVDLLVETGACASKSDARRQLAQGAIRVNGAAIAAEPDPMIGRDDFLDGRVLVIRRGKRNTYLVRLG